MGQAKTEHLKDLLESFDTAMLITHHGEKLHARPMQVVGVEGASTLWFVTSDRSPKAAELRDGRVSVTLQSKGRYVALSGTAELVHDRAKVDALWSASWMVWFPDGKEDPSLVLIRVEVADAELWDNAGSRGLRYAVNAVRGLLRHEVPPEVPGAHERIKPPEESGRIPASRH
jgi:general stress protein 26